jgi:hypothetical protein
MATYSNIGIKLITTGDESGTWGDTTNTNFSDILDEAIAGAVTYNISSDADVTLTVSDGSSSDARHAVINFTSTTLSATRTVTFAPDTLQKTWLVINSTTGGQSLTFKQGSAGTTVTVLNGESAIIYSDGAGATNGAVTKALDSFTNTKITTGTLNATTLDLTNLEVTNVKAKDGTAALTIADSTGKVTVSTELAVDNLNLSGNAITSTNSNGNIDLTPDGTGEVNITKVDIDAGAIDGTTIGGASAAAGSFTNLTANGTINFTGATVSNGGSVTTVDINGGTIDGTAIGSGSASTGAFTTLSASSTTTLSNLTASTALALDASKNVVSVTNTGTGNNVLATSPTLTTPNLGTPSALTLTNATGLPVSTGISGLGANVATFLATPSSSNLAAAVTDETGSGALVFATSPTLVTPNLGTPSALVVTNATGTASININGTVGATTPNTGAFTTLSATGNVTLGDATSDTITANGRFNTDLVPSTDNARDLGTSALQFKDVYGVQFLEDGSNIVSQTDIGTAPNEVPLNQYLGTMAFQDADAITVGQIAVSGDVDIAGTATISSGTADGVLYLNGSKEVTSGSVVTYDGTTFKVDGAAVFNDSGADVDFRVEGDTDANLLFVDASTDRIGVGTNTPGSKFDVSGLTSTTTFQATSTTDSSLVSRLTNEDFQLYAANGVGTSSSGDVKATIGLYFANTIANLNGGIQFTRGGSGTDGWMNFLTSGSEKMRLDAAGNLGLGVTPSAWLSGIRAMQVGSEGGAFIAGNTSSGGTASFGLNAYVNSNSDFIYGASSEASYYAQSAGQHRWFTAPSGTAGNNITFTQAMTLDASGNLLVGQTTFSSTTPGVVLQQTGRGLFVANSIEPIYCNRQGSDGTLVEFAHANSLEGTISVSGATVSYNAFAGSHWSQLQDGSKPDILRGTVMESINELCEWPNEENERLPKCKISDTAGSKKVYGVFMAWDNDWSETNDMYVTAVGAFVCRVNTDVTVQEGDLLESNGDGTARVQADDIIRSSTIGKVTSTVKTHEYDDGSYCVPTVLYCG